jgi:hypothetical protein
VLANAIGFGGCYDRRSWSVARELTSASALRVASTLLGREGRRPSMRSLLLFLAAAVFLTVGTPADAKVRRTVAFNSHVLKMFAPRLRTGARLAGKIMRMDLPGSAKRAGLKALAGVVFMPRPTQIAIMDGFGTLKLTVYKDSKQMGDRRSVEIGGNELSLVHSAPAPIGKTSGLEQRFMTLGTLEQVGDNVYLHQGKNTETLTRDKYERIRAAF